MRKGIYWRKAKQRFCVQMKIGGESLWLGSFVHYVDAVKAIEDAEKDNGRAALERKRKAREQEKITSIWDFLSKPWVPQR